MGEGEVAKKPKSKWVSLIGPIVRSLIGVLPLFLILLQPSSKKWVGAFLGAFHIAVLFYGLSLGVSETIVQSMPKKYRRVAFLIYFIMGLSIYPSWMAASGHHFDQPMGFVGCALLTGVVGIARSFYFKWSVGWAVDSLCAVTPFIVLSRDVDEILFYGIPLSLLMFCQRVKGGIPSE